MIKKPKGKTKAKDENDRLREGTLPHDPEADVEPMAPPALELTDAPTLADAYGLAHLEADRGRQLLSLAKLPPWPDTVPPACGHGWGEHLDQLLGHGLRPGEMVAIGAASAGAGKTAWLMQLVDGVALRNPYLLAGEGAWGPQLTPVLIASEMSPDALAWRSLARWTGYPASTFRAGQSLARRHPSRATELRQAWQSARQALTGEFGQARHWQRLLSPGKTGLAASRGAKLFVEHLRATVEAWRERIAHEHLRQEVVPFVVVDPLQRYQSGHDEVTDLNALARELCAVSAEEGWITLLTSDTNKTAATGNASDGRASSEEGAAAFRGSYNLMHEVTTALYLRRPPLREVNEDEEREGLRYLEAVVVKNRWGSNLPPAPRYRWHSPSMRFYPLPREQTAQDHQREQQSRSERRSKKTNGKPGNEDSDRFGGAL